MPFASVVSGGEAVLGQSGLGALSDQRGFLRRLCGRRRRDTVGDAVAVDGAARRATTRRVSLGLTHARVRGSGPSGDFHVQGAENDRRRLSALYGVFTPALMALTGTWVDAGI